MPNPTPSGRPSPAPGPPRAAPRGTGGHPGVTQPVVSRTADLPAADRPLERSSRRTQRPPPPPLPPLPQLPHPAAAMPPSLQGSFCTGLPLRSPSRPLQPNAAPFEPRARSTLGGAPLQGPRQLPPPQPFQFGHAAGQHPQAHHTHLPQQQAASAHPQQQPPPSAAMASAPSSDDIDDLLADAWAFTNDSAPPQRPPLAHSHGASSETPAAAAAAAAPQQPAPSAAFQQQPSPLPPSLRSLSRTISSASSDATAASLPPNIGLGGHHDGGWPAEDAAATAADGRRFARRSSWGSVAGGGIAAEAHPAAAHAGPFSPQQLPAADAPMIDWDGCRSGASSPAPAPDGGTAARAFSSASAGPHASPARKPAPAAAAYQHAELEASRSNSLGALLPAHLPDDLLNGSPDGASPVATPPGAAAGEPALPQQQLQRPGGLGPLQQEPWPPAHADAPGTRARLGGRFQLPPSSDAFHHPVAPAAATSGGPVPSSAGIAALQTVAAAQFDAQRGLREAVLAAAAQAASAGEPPCALPRLALPMAGSRKQQASVLASPAALTPAAAAAAAQYQLWGASLQGDRPAAAHHRYPPGSPTGSAISVSCNSPLSYRPMSACSLPAMVAAAAANAAPGSPAASASAAGSPFAHGAAGAFSSSSALTGSASSLLRPGSATFVPGSSEASLSGDA